MGIPTFVFAIIVHTVTGIYMGIELQVCLITFTYGMRVFPTYLINPLNKESNHALRFHLTKNRFLSER